MWSPVAWLTSGGGGNRTRVPNSATALQRNDLENGPTDKSVMWSQSLTNEGDCQPLSRPDADGHSGTLLYIAECWPNLPPHIRESILTLVDASVTSQSSETSLT
jgi:hypothetical protein